jgi:hypothetical protein
MGLDFPCGIATMHISGGGDCELLHIMLILYLLFSMVASTEAQISLECSSLEAVPCRDITTHELLLWKSGLKHEA